MAKVKLYDKDTTTFIGDLNDAIECKVTEERNGQFELSLLYPNQKQFSERLIEGNIIQCNAGDNLTNQKFRIYKTRKLMNNKIDVMARHISFDLIYDFVESISIVNQPCNYVLNEIFRRSNFSQHYQGFSDIVNAQNYNMELANCLEAIGGKQGSVLDTFGTGAEIFRDNTNIHVLNRRGNDNGVHITYSKNMTDITVEEDRSEMITRIFAYAKGKDAGGQEILVYAPNKYVDSPNINLYEHPYIRSVDFSDKFDQDVQPTPDRIQYFAEKYFRDNIPDIPKINYKISFIPLSKTTQGGPNDNIKLCDTVYVDDTRYNIQTQAKAIKTVFNVLLNRYDSIELGQPKSTLADLIGTGGGEQGPAGPPGPQGPPGADGNIGDFPDSLPGVPQLTLTLLGLESIQCDWTFENKVYYHYQLYASKVENFTPTAFDLIHEGQTSSFLFAAKPDETWYFRVRAGNTHNKWTEFSSQMSISTVKIDASTFIKEATIGNALIGNISADKINAGKLFGQYIDARNLSVTNGNGKRTLDIDSFGDVSIMPTNFKVLVNGQEQGVITESRYEQDQDSIKLSVNNSSTPNLIPNGKPTVENTGGWNTSDGASFYKVNLPQANNVGLAKTNGDPGYAWTDFIEVVPGRSYTAYGKIFAENNTKGGGLTIIGSQSLAGEWAQVIDFLDVQPNQGNSAYRVFQVANGINYIRMRVNHKGYNGPQPASGYVLWMEEFMIIEGAANNPNYRGSSNEIKNNIVTINPQGMEIQHTDTSKSVFTNESVDFYNNTGYRTLRIKDGGLNFHHPSAVEMVGFIKPSQTGSEKSNNGVTLANYYKGDYVTLGFTDSEDENNWTSSACLSVSNGLSWGRERGTSIVNFPFYALTQSYFRANVDMDYTLNFRSQIDGVPHNVFPTTDNKLGIFGNDGTKIGLRWGTDNKFLIHLFEQESSPSRGAAESYCDWDFKNYTMSNMRTTNVLQAQSAPMMRRSAFTSFIAMPNSYDNVDGDYSVPEKEINTIHSIMSYTQDEVRFVERNNQIISDKTLIVELPQVLSENIENDYHVNISKMSWGDYRIIEKNPYYFEIETNVDNFSFTYEIVGKLLDRNGVNNLSVASMPYLLSGKEEAPEPEKIIEEIL